MEQIDDETVTAGESESFRQGRGEDLVLPVVQTPAAQSGTDKKQEKPWQKGKLVSAGKFGIGEPQGI